MQFACTHCGMVSPDGNWWCQRVECSSRHWTRVLKRGDKFGEFEIKRIVHVMRTATLYEAERAEQIILLKVAHYDTSELIRNKMGYSQYLKNEAIRLDELQKNGVKHPALPRLLFPYQRTTIKDEPYGRLVHQDQLRYYMVLDYYEGEFLREYLDNYSQPHFEYAGWLVHDIAEVVALIHDKLRALHLSVNPDGIFVREDEEGILRGMLFDFGFYKTPYEGAEQESQAGNENLYFSWLSRYINPAYTAPELFSEHEKRGRATDVYGLGLLLYEMLAGRPVYDYKTRTEETIRINVRDNRLAPPLNRVDLSPDVNQFVERSISNDLTQRPPNVVEFLRGIKELFGAPPPEKPQQNRFVAWAKQNYVTLSLALFVAAFVLLLVAGLVISIGNLF